MMRRIPAYGMCLVVLCTTVGFAFQSGEKLAKGKSLYEAKKFRDAEPLFREAAAEAPDSVQSILFLGLTQLELGKTGDALHCLETADQLDPKSDQVKVGLARAYLAQKDLAKAEAALDAAEALNASNAQVYFYRGMLNGNRNDYESAARNFEKSIELDPKNAPAYYYAGIAYSNLKKTDKMVQHFQTFLKLAPDAPEAKKVQSLLRSVR